MSKKRNGSNKGAAAKPSDFASLLQQVAAEPIPPRLKKLADELEERLRQEHPDIDLSKQQD